MKERRGKKGGRKGEEGERREGRERGEKEEGERGEEEGERREGERERKREGNEEGERGCAKGAAAKRRTAHNAVKKIFGGRLTVEGEGVKAEGAKNAKAKSAKVNRGDQMRSHDLLLPHSLRQSTIQHIMPKPAACTRVRRDRTVSTCSLPHGSGLAYAHAPTATESGRHTLQTCRRTDVCRRCESAAAIRHTVHVQGQG